MIVPVANGPTRSGKELIELDLTDDDAAMRRLVSQVRGSTPSLDPMAAPKGDGISTDWQAGYRSVSELLLRQCLPNSARLQDEFVRSHSPKQS